MSMFGGMDRGPEGDAPHLGKLVVVFLGPSTNIDAAAAAFVYKVHEDGWTVDVTVMGDPVESFKNVEYGGNREFGFIPVGTWVTLDEYEGWKIYAAERAGGGGS